MENLCMRKKTLMESEREVGAEEEEEKWAKHYSSYHQMLLVGEGDFSFSLSLAQSFGSASNILGSSLDPYEVVIKKYKEAKSNLENLEKLGASHLHGVDATKMKLHTDLKMRKFDRIIFNFPHAGFYGKEDNTLLIKMHRNLVHGFFRNARGMLRANGEIHLNHKTTAPFCHWNLEELAFQNSLELIECVDFKKEDYPGYKNKRGDGLRCDEPFPLRECSTFKFRFSHTIKKVHRGVTHLASAEHGRFQQFQEMPIQMQQWSNSTDFSYPRAGDLRNMEQISGHVDLPLTISARNGCSRMFDGNLQNMTEMYGRTNYGVDYSVHARRFGFERDLTEVLRTGNDDWHVLSELRLRGFGFGRDSSEVLRTLVDDIHVLSGLHRRSTWRSMQLQRMLMSHES